MAKAITKAEHIRRFLAKKPKATAQECLEVLSQSGIEITKQMFYSVRHAMNKKAGTAVIAQRSRRKQTEHEEFEIDVRTQLAMLEEQNRRLKAVVAALL